VERRDNLAQPSCEKLQKKKQQGVGIFDIRKEYAPHGAESRK
jgi:hypothetical protein